MPTIPTKGQGLQTSLEQVRRQLVAQRARLVDANGRANDRQRTAITARIAQIDVWLADLNKRIGARAWGKLRTSADTMSGVLVGDRSSDETMGFDLGAAIAGALSPLFGPTAQIDGSVGGSGLNVGGSVVGKVTNNAREVVIEIKGVISNIGMWFINEPEWIKTVLAARGWDIRNSVATQTPLGGIGQRTWRVTAMVGSQYNDSQVVTNARNHLTDRGMSVASVAIVQASPASYVSGSADTSGGDGTNAGSTLTSMLAGAALGVGVSTTTLLIGGGLVLVLLLRRR